MDVGDRKRFAHFIREATGKIQIVALSEIFQEHAPFNI